MDFIILVLNYDTSNLSRTISFVEEKINVTLDKLLDADKEATRVGGKGHLSDFTGKKLSTFVNRPT